MLFALLDFRNYRRRLGRYSHASMIRKGLALATQDNFPNWRSLPLGHLLFASTSGSLLSWLVMYTTNGVFSHSAMIYGGGMVNDVTTGGVVRHSMSDYFDGTSYLEVLPPPQGTDLEWARNFMDSIVGDGYNWFGVLRLGLNIAIANHPSFSWRPAADLVLVLVSASFAISFVAPTLAKVVGLITITYLCTVLLNRTVRKKAIFSHFPHLNRK